MEERQYKKRPPGRPRKHEPRVEQPRRRRGRSPAEIEALLDYCREKPGTWVLLDVLKTSPRARDRAKQYRIRKNGPGVWSFVSRIRETEFGPDYGVYGMWQPEGED